MTFRDEFERAAWLSAWDAAESTCASAECEIHADNKIKAMRARMPEFDKLRCALPAGAMQGRSFVPPGEPVAGVKPPTPLGGGRIRYAIQRGAREAWRRMWDRRVVLSHCLADEEHVIDCIYEAMIDAVVDNPDTGSPPPVNETTEEPTAKPERPGTVQGVMPVEPPPDARVVLGRARVRIREVMRSAEAEHAERGIGFYDGMVTCLSVLDAELARLPKPDAEES